MRTIIYTRVSTEDQAEKYGIAAQLRACRKYAAEHGLQVTAEISDEGISGVILDRPGLDRIRQLVRDGVVDVVLMLDTDRLSRELAHLLILKPEIERHARLEFVASRFEDSPSGRMFFGIRGVIAQYERDLTRERTIRGRRERARSGLIVGGRTAYGYEYRAGALIEDRERAAVVRRIFAGYDSGESIRAITRALRESGVPTWSGKKWGHSSIRRILVNETYCGVAHYGLLQREGTVLRRSAGEVISLAVPALVSREQWLRVQARLAENPLSGRPSPAFLLRGILYCAACGKRMHGERGKRDSAYRCAGRDVLRHSGEPCRARASVAGVDAAAWNALVGAFGNPDSLRAALERHEASLRSADPVDSERLAVRVAKLRRREDAALSAMLDPDLADGRAMLKEQYRAICAERRKLEAEISRLDQANRMGLSAAEWVDETAAAIAELVGGMSDPVERQEFARRVVGRAEWDGKGITMTCFLNPELGTTSERCAQFDRLQFVVTARVAA